MRTGIKALDNCIAKWGISLQADTDNPLQQITPLTGRDPRALRMGLPHCILQAIGRQSQDRTVYLHRFTAVYKQSRLLCAVVDEHGQVLEKVYYPRDRKSVQACDIIMQALQSAAHTVPMAA
ncbi:hypothetical protein LJ739_10175 [Aestuariibacter halophilus]|uniref:Uncharacterized protein n=1 Tax=Fluctibacter halophilus TaxID=226011 RepID=A0ABS8G855_9ALTE|nr:hypothetical protein [Aestuariibacter halophilus]MCC2616608.1 hypothetical protein [Aestuariibacter halophilus]